MAILGDWEDGVLSPDKTDHEVTRAIISGWKDGVFSPDRTGS